MQRAQTGVKGLSVSLASKAALVTPFPASPSRSARHVLEEEIRCPVIQFALVMSPPSTRLGC
ncbi:hypothetical protein NQZ68_036672 [Dissostichus eleginoides]|nr:hypothetical protein NQZ68_036672 [Dissostichus eleginoides]